jgi:predicted acyltransferase
MRTSWWGILGLIGWGYLFNSLIYLLLRNKINFLFIIFLFLMFMNVQENNFFDGIPAFKVIVGASNHLFVLSGILTSIFFVKSLKNRKENLILKILFVFSIIFLVYGLAIRPSFHISKIYGSPSWVAICTAINLFSFIILFLLVEKTNFNRFLKPIKAAGTSTLTCYLIPYLVYPLLVLIDFSWPEWMIAGTVGLVKSLLFSLLIIVFVRILEKNNIKLKI